jgi:ATP-grasp domain, R2K clade family 3
MAEWVVQNNAVDLTQADAVARAVTITHGRVYGAKVLLFSNVIEFWDKVGPSGRNVVPYGSTDMVRMARGRGWDGVFFNENFDTDVWNQNRDDMLNRDSRTMVLSETIRFLEEEPVDKRVFIRPRVGAKVFAGKEMTIGDILGWEKNLSLGKYRVTPDTQVSIAPVKQIDAETRWFVVNGRVVDGSIYRLRGQRVLIHEENQASIYHAQSLADRWLPIHTCVMDTAETSDGVKVIEFNCFNSSGFYNHDISKVIAAVNSMFDNV